MLMQVCSLVSNAKNASRRSQMPVKIPTPHIYAPEASPQYTEQLVCALASALVNMVCIAM